MEIKTILCLANSRKPPSGRCIAGKEFDDGVAGAWIRPVSTRPGREVSEEERRYEAGTRVQLLDIVAVPIVQGSPMGHQVENVILDDRYYWEKNGEASWKQIQTAVDAPDPRYWSHSQSTYHGHNDKVGAHSLGQIGSSLKLIAVPTVQLLVRAESGFEDSHARRRLRARFEIEDEDYLLSVTDPEMEEQYLQQGVGTYELRDAVLCISLAEEWRDFAFRVVASIITPQRCKV